MTQRPLSPSLPLRLGRYVVTEFIARGGMGAVYRATQPDVGRDVAIKVLESLGDPLQIERFRVEVRAMARLRHANIVSIHEYGEFQGHPYFVMDLVQGRSLAHNLEQQGPWPAKEALHLTLKLAKALAYAHQASILHRDVKPDNVLLTEAGEPLLTDFGLAKDTASEAQRLTQTDIPIGTPLYMSPEQLYHPDRVDGRSDVYSLGATLYELLAGERPPPAYLDRDAKAPSRIRPGLHRDLDVICLACLARDPDRRYPSMQALAEDLERAIRQEPIQATPPGLGYRLERWAKRNTGLSRVMGLSLGAALVGLFGLLAWTVNSGSGAARRDAIAAAEMAAAQRSRTLAALSEDAEEALNLLDASRVSDDESALDRRTGQALVALQASRSWRVLDPGDPRAARCQFTAAMALGDVALKSKQWDLAKMAYGQAAGLGVEDQAALTAQQSVQTRRDERARIRRAKVEAIIHAAGTGQLARQPRGLEEAVYTLVSLSDPQTVSLLAALLTRITRRLEDAERSFYLAAEHPDADERTTGEGRILGIEAALRARSADVATAEHVNSLRLAERRIVRRAALGSSGRRPVFLELLSRYQRDVLQQGLLDAAWLACSALGHMGSPDGAVEALSDYLAAERAPSRALPAAFALVRLNADSGEGALRSACARNGIAFTEKVEALRNLVNQADGR